MQSERKDKITEIKTMLDDMTDKQVENVHVYTAEEYKKPNHEAVALDAIIKLSKKYETEIGKDRGNDDKDESGNNICPADSGG